jgi:beta-glucanase (GH16 family)
VARPTRPLVRLRLLVPLLSTLLAVGCSGGGGNDPDPTPPTLEAIAITPSPVSVAVGATRALAVTGTFSDDTTAPITTGLVFSSSAEGTATVSAAGEVTGVAAGSAVVTAATGGRTATVTVTVTASAPTLASVAVTPNPVALTVGGTAQLALTGTDTAGETADLTASASWTAAAGGVVSVSASGLVTALTTGDSTVTGTVTVGDVTRTATAAVAVGDAAGYDPGAGWNLVWADEFAGSAVDLASWTFDLGAGGWGNNESQYYKAENATVADGQLTITAKVEAAGDAPYTSARMQTSQKRSFTYGKFSMRAKLPYSQGMWPAFWLLGASCSSFDLYGGTVPWPACGEADVMEMIGGLDDGTGDYTSYGAVHYSDAGERNAAQTFAQRFPDKLSNDFHVYELVWTPHSFTWKFDGVAFGTKILGPGMEEFSKPMFLLLNLAIGGAWGGWADHRTVFPQSYVVDWVRVYDNATTEPGGTPNLATTWHLSNAPSTGVTPVVEALDPNKGTVSGYQPLKTLAASASATWVGPPLTGAYEEGAWSVGLFTASPAGSAVLKVEVFKTAADGSLPVLLGSKEVDVSRTGGGNHYSWFTLTGVPLTRFANERIKLVVTHVSGAAVEMIYNGNDFDSLIATPWSATDT